MYIRGRVYRDKPVKVATLPKHAIKVYNGNEVKLHASRSRHSVDVTHQIHSSEREPQVPIG
jgi:hypothetical protein